MARREVGRPYIVERRAERKFGDDCGLRQPGYVVVEAFQLRMTVVSANVDVEPQRRPVPAFMNRPGYRFGISSAVAGAAMNASGSPLVVGGVPTT